MNKRTIVAFLSLCVCIVNMPESYGMSAAGAGADATAEHSAQLSSQPKQIPSHITQLIGRTYYPADRYPDAIAQVPAKRALAQAAVKKYLDEGGDVNAGEESKNRWTLLHYAAYNGDEALATLLISHGANLEAQTASAGGSPLLQALHADEGGNRMPVVKVLIEAGADTNFITDKFEFIDHALGTVRRYSSEPLPSAGYIAQHKITVKDAIKQALTSVASMQAALIQKNLGDFLCGPTEQEDQDFGLLKRAVFNSLEMGKMLPWPFISSTLDAQPSLLTKKDESGHTLLSFAEYVQATEVQTLIMLLQKEKAEHIKANEALKQKKLAEKQTAQKELLKQATLANDIQAIDKIDDQIIDSKYNDNKTALILAAEKGHEKAVDALLTKKANLACLDDTFKSALWYATQYGHKAIVERILKEIPLQAVPALMRREIENAHELAQKKEHEVVINKELYKQIKELLAPYLANTQAQAAAK